MKKGITTEDLGNGFKYHSISYEAKTDCGLATGMLLTNGKLTEIRGIKVVKFDQKVEGYPICLKYETRPELAKLVKEYKAIEAKEKATDEAKWEATRKKEEAIDNKELKKMEAEIKKLRKKIPGNHIEVKVIKTGDLDGDSILEYIVDGIKISWNDIVVHGWANAIRPGAMGAFREICVASIDKKLLHKIKKARKEAKKAKEEAKEKVELEIKKKFAEAKTIGKKVLLKTWMADCNDPNEECNIDNMAEYAMPDGNTEITRQHTW